jgi:hypothetical protein
MLKIEDIKDVFHYSDDLVMKASLTLSSIANYWLFANKDFTFPTKNTDYLKIKTRREFIQAVKKRHCDVKKFDKSDFYRIFPCYSDLDYKLFLYTLK